jgi:RNA polymerase sigma factor (sigma-70 family)
MNETGLLAEFRDRKSEDAFTALVRAHVDFVYATALRQTGDAGLAEEITQDVFVLLARKAASLGRHKTIVGWLYQTTLHRVRQRIRTELRRRRREVKAAEITADATAGESVWKPLVPLLDEGLESMDEEDRLAVLLHCLEGRTFREVGETLGLGEDAARKRVNRALDRLGDFFRRHGFAVPSITAGAALFVGGVAPASLVGSAVSAGTSALSAGTLGTLMASTAMKVGLASVLAGAAVTPILLQQATIRNQTAELAALGDTGAELERVRLENARLAGSRVDSNELVRLRDGYRELMRLRAEVARLRAQAVQVAAVEAMNASAAEIDETAEQTATDSAPGSYRAELTATVPLGATLVTGGWEIAPGRRAVVLLRPELMDTGSGTDRQILVTSTFAEASEDMLYDLGLDHLFAETNLVSDAHVAGPGEASTILERLNEVENASILAAPRVSMLDGNQAQISTLGPLPGSWSGLVSATADLIPRLSADGNAVDLTVIAELAERYAGQEDAQE